MRLLIFLSLLLAALAASIFDDEDDGKIFDQIALESEIEESTMPFESGDQVAVAPPETSPSLPKLPFGSLNEYLRYLIRSELKSFQSSQVLQKPLVTQPAVQSISPNRQRPVLQQPFYLPPHVSQPNFYYPPHYGAYYPPYYQPPYQAPYQAYYNPFVGPVTYKSHLNKWHVESRRPFPGPADEQLSDEEALSKLNSLRVDQEGAGGHLVQPSISVATDLSSVTITFPSIASVLNSLQAVADQLTSVSITTATVLVPGVSVG